MWTSMPCNDFTVLKKSYFLSLHPRQTIPWDVSMYRNQFSIQVSTGVILSVQVTVLYIWLCEGALFKRSSHTINYNFVQVQQFHKYRDKTCCEKKDDFLSQNSICRREERLMELKPAFQSWKKEAVMNGNRKDYLYIRLSHFFLLLFGAGRPPATVWSTEWASRTPGCTDSKMNRRKKRERRETSTSEWPSSWPGISLSVWCVFGERQMTLSHTHTQRAACRVFWFTCACVSEYTCTSMIMLMYGCEDLQFIVILPLKH